MYALIFNTGSANFQDWPENVQRKFSKIIISSVLIVSQTTVSNGLTLQQHMRQAVKAALKIYLQNDTILFMSSEACDWLAFCNRDRRMPWTMSWPWLVTTWFPFYKDKNRKPASTRTNTHTRKNISYVLSKPLWEQVLKMFADNNPESLWFASLRSVSARTDKYKPKQNKKQINNAWKRQLVCPIFQRAPSWARSLAPSLVVTHIETWGWGRGGVKSKSY